MSMPPSICSTRSISPKKSADKTAAVMGSKVAVMLAKAERINSRYSIDAGILH
jgi:hypothetical protein